VVPGYEQILRENPVVVEFKTHTASDELPIDPGHDVRAPRGHELTGVVPSIPTQVSLIYGQTDTERIAVDSISSDRLSGRVGGSDHTGDREADGLQSRERKAKSHMSRVGVRWCGRARTGAAPWDAGRQTTRIRFIIGTQTGPF
jgi:hypothetical protein